ncbi:MAG: hypothetical protein ACTS6J_15540 [Burkholderiales bacterium]
MIGVKSAWLRAHRLEPVSGRKIVKHQTGLLGGAIAFYAVWTAATWYFEGRIDTLLRPQAMGDRIAYAYVVNLLLGGGLYHPASHLRRDAGGQAHLMPNSGAAL